MRRTNRFNSIAVLIFLSGSLSPGIVAQALASEAEATPPPANMPFSHGRGYELFQENCAVCHGGNLEGTDQGPPLLHGYYNPSHHGDAAFYRAIESGSPQHHWNFGDMPPVAGINDNQAEVIVEYIRWHQREAGLY